MEYQKIERQRMITLFIRKEAREYACYCGFTGMRPKKIYFSNRSWTKVDLSCEACDKGRTVTMNYPHEITSFEF